MGVDEDRRDRLVAALRQDSLHGLLVSAPTDVLLVTGYWPVMGSSVAVLSADGECRLIVPEDEAELASHMTAVPLSAYRPVTLDRLSTSMEALRGPLDECLNALGLASGRVGLRALPVEQPASYVASLHLGPGMPDLVRTLAPGCEVVGADHLLEAQKARKTAAEVNAIRQAASQAARGFSAIAGDNFQGVTEAEIASHAQAAFDVGSAGGEARSDGSFFCMSGPNSATADAAYARTRHRRVESGDLVMVHANTCSGGFWTDITRTYTCGEPDARQQVMRAAIAEAREAALKMIRPGVRAKDVDDAARSVLTARGFGKEFTHGVGHGVGFAAASPIARPRLHPQSPDTLAEGMTLNVEPAIYIPGYGGMRHCDMVAVTANGAEVLTPWGAA